MSPPIIKDINDKQIWEQFLLAQEWAPFLQSWDSGEHFQLCGHKIFRLGVFDGILKGICLIIKIEAKRGTYLYCPYGPILEDWKVSFHVLSQALKDLARLEGANFIKMAPYAEDNPDFYSALERENYRRAQIHVLSENSWLLDLSPSEDELFAGMRKTHRNLIRRAQKEGVEIIQSQNLKDIDIFFQLYKETGKRHHFVLYPYDFIRSQIAAFLNDGQVTIYFAKYNKEIINSAIIMFYGKEAAYHHGASSEKYSKLPAAYLLQWEAIRDAKRRGHKLYNFWGIDEGSITAPAGHPFAGITLFKTGFGGYLRKLTPCHDLPINWKYWVNYWIEKGRRIYRGF
ncbi:MAG: peptidoglycan bridge formation glycyltransferase FemA/FemB family protein [Parcubacteria group bacterium]|nr:peptidoglycan bridge formation glycyltransferase FemA/FemB family protein [Parcubacteria group bacterium]